ncbi:MAG: DNA polymerase domain-containing protein, partial [Promethearchaeota archaeon]
MPKDQYWLIDAAYDDGIVQLTYIRSPDGEIETFQHEFTPYFFALPVNLGEPVTRKELFSGQQISVAKVPSSSSARGTREWERELNPALSYVCDNKLRFGCPHRRSNGVMQLDLSISEGQQEAFAANFDEVAKQDSLKYNFLNEFFQFAIQPVPDFLNKHLKLKSKHGKTGLYEGMMLARIANLPLKRVLGSRRVSEWIRTMLHTAYRNLGILIPDAEELKRGYKPHRVEGALTIAPKSGAYYNMAVLDFESLYPSCIDYYNLSYETIDCGHAECKQSKVPGSEHYVCHQRRGIFSALIGALKDLRIHWYKHQVRRADINPEDRNRAKVISDLLKLFLVSCFGCTIRIPGLACPPLAESVTAYGRWALQTSWNLAEEYGMSPVYGDTDSLFLDNPVQQQIERLIAKIKEDLGLILSIDVTYPLCVLSSAKKAYFGMLADGTPDIKGITLGKSSTPPLFRDIFLEVVSPLGGVDAPEKLTERIPKVL